MPKILQKKDLLNDIESKIVALQLLYSTIKSDKSRKPETLEQYKKKYEQVIGNRYSVK